MKKAKQTVLIVEDSPVTQALLKKLIQNDGYVAIQAWNGREATDMIANKKIDAILMDIILPDGNGKELLKQWRCQPDTVLPPIVFLTNTLNLRDDKGDSALKIEGRTYRAFAKPLHAAKLLSVLRKEINRYQNSVKKTKLKD